MFVLTKLILEDGKYSLLGPGYCEIAHLLWLFDWETNKRKENQKLTDVDVGWQVIITDDGNGDYSPYLRTSKIQEILERTENTVKFRTETSIYLLEERSDIAQH